MLGFDLYGKLKFTQGFTIDNGDRVFNRNCTISVTEEDDGIYRVGYYDNKKQYSREVSAMQVSKAQEIDDKDTELPSLETIIIKP